MIVTDDTRNYHDELTKAMNWLGEQDNTIFIGQGVGNPGTGLSKSLEQVPQGKRIEFPVAEEMQVGMCIGMSLKGLIPICIIPRWNFALRAADQIVNHLDRLPIFGNGYKPRVIIRVAVPSTIPFNPGPQHDDDFTSAFYRMFRTIHTYEMLEANSILPSYQHAFETKASAVMVEFTDKYKNARAT